MLWSVSPWIAASRPSSLKPVYTTWPTTSMYTEGRRLNGSVLCAEIRCGFVCFSTYTDSEKLRTSPEGDGSIEITVIWK